MEDVICGVPSPEWAQDNSLGFCSGCYCCCLLKPEPAEVPSYAHQLCWGLCYVLTQILLLCLNTPSSCIWMWWKSSGRERAGTVKLPLHLIFLKQAFMRRRYFLGAVVFPYFHFPFQAMHAGCTGVLQVQQCLHTPRGEVVAGPWERPLGRGDNNNMKHPGCIFQMKV